MFIGNPLGKVKPSALPLHVVALFSFSISSLILPPSSASQPPQSETESIQKSIHASIGWAKNQDFNLLNSGIANDSAFIEVSPGKRITRGFEEFKKGETFWGSPDFRAVRYEIRDLVINRSRPGDVAWFYCILDDINEWKGKPANWMNTRWTGVLEKREGQWVIVQMHFSFAREE